MATSDLAESIVTTIPDPGLGNSSYLVDLGDGRALAVDACRDLRRLQAEARACGLRIAFAADTHLHADFLSGAVQLSATENARIIASRAGGREFDHVGLESQQELDLGGLTIRAMTTPGHTDEHIAFVLLDGDRTLGVFTGGSLIVGSAARTDLVSTERTEELARSQYRSLRRLVELPEGAVVWPTHGGGSFCSTAASQPGAVSTIAGEQASNPLLAAPDEDTFVQMLLATIGSFPPYFVRLGEQNRRGPSVLPPQGGLDPIAAARVGETMSAGTALVDVRPAAAFAHAHPVGALSIPLRPAFASWLGWLAPHDRPIIVLRDANQDLEEVFWQAAKIGYENIVGELGGGIEAWVAASLPTNSLPLAHAADAGDARVLDIRQTAEFKTGHVPGAIHVELGSLPRELAKLANEPIVVMCGQGERAMGAASLLSRAGFSDIIVLDGGPDDWAQARGVSLETGT